MDDTVKLELPNGLVIERPRKIANMFLKSGAREILPKGKPEEIGKKTVPKIPQLGTPVVLTPSPEEYPKLEVKKEEPKFDKEAYVVELKKQNRDVLVEEAKKKGLPEDEWFNLTKPKLLAYLIEKT